jgi:hypothetical protein
MLFSYFYKNTTLRKAFKYVYGISKYIFMSYIRCDLPPHWCPDLLTSIWNFWIIVWNTTINQVLQRKDQDWDAICHLLNLPCIYTLLWPISACHSGWQVPDKFILGWQQTISPTTRDIFISLGTSTSKFIRKRTNNGNNIYLKQYFHHFGLIVVFQTIIQKFQILVSKSRHQCGGRSHRIYDMKIYFNTPYTSLKALRNVVFFNSNDSMKATRTSITISYTNIYI